MFFTSLSSVTSFTECIRNGKAKSGKNQIVEDIEILNQLQEELNCIEHLLNVIEVCEPDEHATGITISWSDVTGNNYHYDFVIDGSDEVSELLKGIAYHERKLLRTSLKAQIRKMSAPL